MSLHQECVGHSDRLFEYDDKCVSQYTHLPSPKGAELSFFAGMPLTRSMLHALQEVARQLFIWTVEVRHRYGSKYLS
eukprot:6172710-Pleurochrysis_carterae.AAC.6